MCDQMTYIALILRQDPGVCEVILAAYVCFLILS